MQMESHQVDSSTTDQSANSPRSQKQSEEDTAVQALVRGLFSSPKIFVSDRPVDEEKSIYYSEWQTNPGLTPIASYHANL